METITLYHGTAIDSALHILNNGLSTEKLSALQTRPVQSGPGLYVAFEPRVAWYFATLAPLAIKGCTVIEILLRKDQFEHLLETGQARRETITSVLFNAEQVVFFLPTFDFLNQHAEFRPYRED